MKPEAAAKLPGLFARLEAMNARRINHKGAAMPAPSLDLLQDAARNMHIAAAVELDQEPRPWAELSTDSQDLWLHQSRAAWATFALAGGATVEEVAGPDDQDQEAKPNE